MKITLDTLAFLRLPFVYSAMRGIFVPVQTHFAQKIHVPLRGKGSPGGESNID
jgi:hypothetical protein